MSTASDATSALKTARSPADPGAYAHSRPAVGFFVLAIQAA